MAQLLLRILTTLLIILVLYDLVMVISDFFEFQGLESRAVTMTILYDNHPCDHRLKTAGVFHA